MTADDGYKTSAIALYKPHVNNTHASTASTQSAMLMAILDASLPFFLRCSMDCVCTFFDVAVARLSCTSGSNMPFKFTLALAAWCSCPSVNWANRSCHSSSCLRADALISWYSVFSRNWRNSVNSLPTWRSSIFRIKMTSDLTRSPFSENRSFDPSASNNSNRFDLRRFENEVNDGNCACSNTSRLMPILNSCW